MWLEKSVLLLWGLLLAISDSWATDIPYTNRPRFYSENGHLFITSALDRNITLRTSGQGYININNDNLGEIVAKARHVSDSIERFQNNELHQFQQRLTTLSNTVSGSRGLKERLKRLERSHRNTSTLSPSVMQNARLSRLNNTIFNLARDLASFQTYVNTDDCLSNPCQNGGTCYDLINGFRCICLDSWEGALCDSDVNECANFAGTDLGCQNNAQCVNKRGSYECLCPSNEWYGIHCTRRTFDCTKSSSQEMCGNGFCVNSGGNTKGFSCICKQGWTTDENGKCTKDVNECESAKYVCSHDPFVQCINLPGSFACGMCPSGYSGNGHYCTDIDECAENNGGCSLMPKVKCINTPGSRDCFPCPAGYYGDGITCSPSLGGLCSANNGGCHHLATCVTAGEVVSCHCPPGYAGTGYGINGCYGTAVVVNQCPNSYCKNGGTCVPQTINGIQPFHCNCLPGFSGDDCGLHLTNPCLHNPCLNNGNCTVTSSFTIHGFKCSCEIGFSGDRCEIEDSDCISTIELETGVLRYPRSFVTALHETSQNCHWVIKVNETKAVLLSFINLNTEINSCSTEYVEIFNGQDSRSASLGHFCGNHLPNNNNISSSTHVISVYFKSNKPRSSGEKFSLKFQAVKPDCMFHVQIDRSGLLDSPGYPNKYPPNQDCWWYLFAPFGKKIKLIFYSLDLKQDPSSPCDVLQVFDGFLNFDKIIGNYCNETSSVPLVSNNHDILIYFHTDDISQGSGFRIGYEQISGCGDILTEPSGVISPKRDTNTEGLSYVNDVFCEWKIQFSVGELIVLNFQQFELEDCDDCSCDFVQIFDGPSPESPLIGKWCGTEKPPKFKSSSNIVTVVFVADSDINEGTFQLHYSIYCGGIFTMDHDEIISPSFPYTMISSTPCIYRIEQPVGKAINLKISDLYLPSSNCDTDFLEVRDGDHENSTLIAKFCESNKFFETVISKYNYLYLKFFSTTTNVFAQKGFRATYTTFDVKCGGIIKGVVGTIASPLEDDTYPDSVKCNWVIVAPIGYFIQLSWSSFHIELGRECRYDYVEVFDNSTTVRKHPSLGKICGSSIPSPVTSVGNIITIEFRSDHSIGREGFLAYFQALDGSRYCDGTFHSVIGEIKSPNFPENYPFNKVCIYKIIVPSHQQIQLTVDKFHLEFQHTCGYDYLEIRNGALETSPLIGTYCGTEIPPTIVSFTNSLYIKFVSDTSSSFGGFKIRWDGTSTGCGGTLTAVSGSIYSPNYPQPYSSFGSCFWKISVSQGSKIQLTIVDIDLEDHYGCNLDYIRIFDGPNIKSKLVGQYCNSMHPPHTLSSSNQLYIEFVSDISLQGRGFHIAYTTVCNTTITGHRGVIESLNFPSPYPTDKSCAWTIQAPKGNNISYSFSHFEVENSHLIAGCEFDYLELTEGDGKNPPSRSLGKFCGDELPHNNVSTMDHVYLTFHSDHLSLGHKGFHLEWKVSGCGGLLTRSTGTFKSPNYPGPYQHSIICEWSITLDWGSSIEITVNTVDLEASTGCTLDYLQIFGGPDSQSPQLAKLCYNKEPVILTTSGNHAFIRFSADHSYTGRGFFATYHEVKSKCGGKFTNSAGEISSPNYPHNYDNNEECEWLIKVPQNHLINLTFVDFDTEVISNREVTDIVYVYDSDSINSNPIFNYSGKLQNLPVKHLLSTSNVILVQFKSDSSETAKGFKATYRIACGARIVTSNGGLISTADTFYLEETYSSENRKCIWYIIAEDLESRVTLTFNHLNDIGSIYGEDKCFLRNITVYDGENEDSPVLKHFCGKKIPTSIWSSGHALTLTVTKAPYMYFGHVEATYSVLPTACGGILSSEHGTFASPNYPEGYHKSVECIWEIKTSPGNRVMLNFIDFDIESSEHCNLDYLEVRRETAIGKLHNTFCGSEKPESINVSFSLWIKFSSDELGTAKGFLAEYSLSHGNELYGVEGDIASPFYPLNSILEGSFKWTITVNTGSVVRLLFKDMFIESYGYRSLCSDNSIKIFDGRDETSPLLGTYCGTQIPEPILSGGDTVTVLLDVDQAVHHGSSFFLHWEQTSKDTVTTEVSRFGNCSEVIGLGLKPGWNSTYTFTSPNYPEYYANDLQCEWIIETTVENHITLKFNKVDLEVYQFQCLDYVQVFKESENGWELLHDNICRPNETSIEFIATHRMKVVMISDNLERNTGFSATAQAVCGGTMKQLSGIIDTTYLKDRTSSQFISCTWIIIGKSGRTIDISFDKFDLSQDTTCSHNYVLLRNGGHEDSPLLGSGKYCGTTKPKLETSTNRLYISYSARKDVPGIILKFKEISVACGGDIELTALWNSSTITSPNYPNVPLPHTVCVWKIFAPPGEIVQLDFDRRFDLLPSSSCQKEYLEVRDGATELSPMIGNRICYKSSTLKTTENAMYVKYFTDIETPSNGFSAIVKIGTCGGSLNVNSWRHNIIQSPNYPEPYPLNTRCDWRVNANDGSYLEFKIKEYELRSSSSICTKESDYLNIAETDPLNPSTELDNITICGSSTSAMKTSTFTTDTNTAVIHFVSKPNLEPSPIRRFSIETISKKNQCGGRLEFESGTIKSPGYGEPDTLTKFSTFCHWIIIVPEDRRVTLKFIDFDLDPAVDRISYFVPKVQVFSGFFSKNFRGSQPKGTTYKSSSNRMTVIYANHFRTSHRGFKAEFSSNEPKECGGNLEESGIINVHVENMMHCSWVRHSDNPLNKTFSIHVSGTFGTDASKREACHILSEPFVVWFASKQYSYNDDLGCVNYFRSTPHIISNPLPVTSITFTYFRDNGTKPGNMTMKYKTDPCGGLINAVDSVVISSIGYPQNYPVNLDCTWKVIFPEGQINITFEALNLKEPYTVLEDKACIDYVIIHNGANRVDPSFDPICGSKPPFSIISQTNMVWIEFHSNEEDDQKSGFKIRMTSITSGCGGYFHANEGSFHSPNFPNKYPKNTECEWEIRSETGYSLRLTFVDRFHIESSKDCVHDYIEIFDYKDGNWVQLNKLCGRDQPSTVNATSFRMKVIFHSNEAIESDGFKAVWNVNCGGEFTVSGSGVITSPSYPENYPNSINCTYTLIAKKGTGISGEFMLPYDIEDSNDGCVYDNLTVTTYEFKLSYWNVHFGKVENKYCGSQLPPPITKQQKIVLSFVSDSSNTRSGFSFHYNYVNICGNTNMTEPGLISVPQRFHSDCMWFITAPEGKIVTLKITIFEPDLRQCMIHLNIWDKQIGYKLIKKYCGSPDKSEYRSTSNTMAITFESSYLFYSFQGVVDFSYDCGGIINVTKDLPYILKSLDVDKNGQYEENLKCEWNIIAPSDFLLQVTIMMIDIQKCGPDTKCYCDYLKIYDGSHEQAEKIGMFCGNMTTTYPLLTSSSNQLFVRFVTDNTENNAGFEIKFEALISPCGQRERWVNFSSFESLMSPGFPGIYPHRIVCHWYLKSNQPYSQIKIHFVMLDIEKSPSCSKDRLVIRDIQEDSSVENSMQELQNIKYCGKTPSDFLSNVNMLQLTFVKASENQAQGFHLQYSLHDCNKIYTEGQGHIHSYFKSSTCEIYITTPGSDDKISLYFNSFNSSTPCDNSKIVVRDGQSGNSALLLEACGPVKPNPVFSSGNSLFIYIKFDVQGGYYDLTYTSTNKDKGCGGKLHGNKGSFASPQYPLLKNKATDCRWNIAVPHEYYVEFTFNVFDIEARNCSTDYIEFFTTKEETSEEWFFTRFCGKDNPAKVSLPSNTGYVHYVTSANNNGTGWVLHFESKL